MRKVVITNGGKIGDFEAAAVQVATHIQDSVIPSATIDLVTSGRTERFRYGVKDCVLLIT